MCAISMHSTQLVGAPLFSQMFDLAFTLSGAYLLTAHENKWQQNSMCTKPHIANTGKEPSVRSSSTGKDLSGLTDTVPVWTTMCSGVCGALRAVRVCCTCAVHSANSHTTGVCPTHRQCVEKHHNHPSLTTPLCFFVLSLFFHSARA